MTAVEASHSLRKNVVTAVRRNIGTYVLKVPLSKHGLISIRRNIFNCLELIKTKDNNFIAISTGIFQILSAFLARNPLGGLQYSDTTDISCLSCRIPIVSGS